MNLKYTYQRFTSSFLLIAMVWNITGWLGMGLINAHSLNHSGGEHCEVSFCYCEIEDGEKICTCHHPELHAAKRLNSHSNIGIDSEGNHTPDSAKDSSYCYYSKSHDSPVQPDAVIAISDFRSLFLYSKEVNQSYDILDYLNNYSFSLNKGFEPSLFRPPIA